MKEVFEQYGSVLIAALIAATIITLLFCGVCGGRVSLGQVSGECLTAGTQNQLKQTGTSAYRELHDRQISEISGQI